jgi:acetyl esterase/lipase
MTDFDFDGSGPYAVAYEDLEYAHVDGISLLARVYRPRGADGPWPGLVDVHGGAWCYFDRTVDAYIDEALAASGMVVVALDFRQGESGRWPRAAADVAAGIRWTRGNARRLGIRAESIGATGGSTGGHLAMLAALRPGAPELATTPVAGGDGISGHVDYVLPLWPILDPPARYRYLLGRRHEPPREAGDRLFQAERLIAAHEVFFTGEAEMARASVQRIVEEREFEALPPIWLAHPELDENVTLAMSERFVAAYRAAGGAAELEVFPGVGHGFANFPGDAADHAIVGMRRFIARQIARS